MTNGWYIHNLPSSPLIKVPVKPGGWWSSGCWKLILSHSGDKVDSSVRSSVADKSGASEPVAYQNEEQGPAQLSSAFRIYAAALVMLSSVWCCTSHPFRSYSIWKMTRNKRHERGRGTDGVHLKETLRLAYIKKYLSHLLDIDSLPNLAKNRDWTFAVEAEGDKSQNVYFQDFLSTWPKTSWTTLAFPLPFKCHTEWEREEGRDSTVA